MSAWMTLDAPTIALLVGVGVIAGLVNTLAGGGSFLALPAFIFAGLPAPVANGTNRIAVLLQSLVGARAMYRRVPFDLRATLTMAVPTVFGAVGGAYVATRLDAGQMRLAIGIALLCGAVLIALRPQRWLARPAAEAAEAVASSGPRVATWLALLVVGFYGGFLQAGVGALLIIVLAGPGRLDLLEATGAKNLIIASFTVVSLVIFALNDAVDLVAGLTMAAGSMIGAELGARLAVRGGRRLITAAVVVALVMAGLKLLGVL